MQQMQGVNLPRFCFNKKLELNYDPLTPKGLLIVYFFFLDFINWYFVWLQRSKTAENASSNSSKMHYKSINRLSDVNIW